MRVRDDGVGIAEADLARIFEMFFQGDARADSGHGGLGLGLALVRQLVELHGGTRRRCTARAATREANSACACRGSSMRPLRRQRAAGAKAPPAHPPRRILVVDDNRDAAESLALMLRTSGNEVDTVFDGAGPWRPTAQFKPEVILMDLGMPKLDGYEAARTIRSNAARR